MYAYKCLIVSTTAIRKRKFLNKCSLIINVCIKCSLSSVVAKKLKKEFVSMGV